MRKLYWYFTAYIKKHGWVFILSLVAAIAFFSITIPLITKKITIRKKYYIGIIGEYTLDNLPLEITSKLSSGLTKVKKDGGVVPMLSERWAVEDDGKTYRFIIKKGLVWQDNKPLTPNDVIYNFSDVETIATPNDVIFKLPDSFSPFPSVVSAPLLRDAKDKFWFFFERPTLIGIGHNKISSYTKQGNNITQLTIDSPEERIIYRFYLTENDAIQAFAKGEIDILNNIHDISLVKDWPRIVIASEINHSQYLALFFNNAHPNFTKNIRQAFSYAIAKADDKTRALGPINPNSWAYLAGGKAYEKNLDRAIERLLDGLPSQAMDVTLTTTSLFTKEAEDIKQQLSEMLNRAYEKCVSSKSVENKDLCENLKYNFEIRINNFPDTNNFDLLLIGQESPLDPDQYFLWHSGQPTNFMNYKNTKIDSLLEKGRQETNQQERIALYQEFQQFLLEDPPAVFLRYLQSYSLKRN